MVVDSHIQPSPDRSPPHLAKRCAGLAALLATAFGCNAPEPPATTGGTSIPLGPCGRGLAVVQSDYQSTNVSLVGLQGEALSTSFVSSATESAQLAAPLSGDVVVPTMPSFGDDILLIDRYPASVLTWVRVVSAEVRAQLNVSTGYAANPQDYLALSNRKAYVSRYERNRQPGAEPFDRGSDLLIVDPSLPEITGRIDLDQTIAAEEQGLEPHPNRMVVVGQSVWVLLAVYSADYLQSGSSRLARIDPATDELVGVLVLEGLHGCTALGVSPQGSQLAVACSGDFGGGSTPSLEQSGVVLLQVDGQGELQETSRWLAAELSGQPLGLSVEFVGEQALLAIAMGQFGTGGEADRPDQLLAIDLESGEHHVVLSSLTQPFELGEIRCTSPCTTCYLADAERGVLASLQAQDGGIVPGPTYPVDTTIGLPPRLIGRF